MSLATNDDIQVHLPSDKILVTNITDLASLQTDAERIIKGYLAGTFAPTTLAGWNDPTASIASPNYVPVLIRAVAGRFIAAFAYRRYYSEDSLDDPQYAQRKYDEAMSMLNQIISGELVLNDVTEVVNTGSHMTSLDFYPNDTADGPKFTMDLTF